MKIDWAVKVRILEQSQFQTLWPKIRKLDDCADLGRVMYIQTWRLHWGRGSIRDVHAAEVYTRHLSYFCLHLKYNHTIEFSEFLYVVKDGWCKFLEPGIFRDLGSSIWGYWYVVGCDLPTQYNSNCKSFPSNSINNHCDAKGNELLGGGLRSSECCSNHYYFKPKLCIFQGLKPCP